MTIVQREVQTAKCHKLAEIAEEDLETIYKKDEKSCKYKVMLLCDYHQPIDLLMKLLPGYRPLHLTGDESKKQRQEIFKLFTAPNDDYRLLIANTKVCARGLNFMDKTGEHLVRLYIMPSFDINMLHQASLRTYRLGAVGRCYVSFFYGMDSKGFSEIKIIHSLAKKGKIMGIVHEEQNIKFPGEFENWYDEDPKEIWGDQFSPSWHIPKIE